MAKPNNVLFLFLIFNIAFTVVVQSASVAPGVILEVVANRRLKTYKLVSSGLNLSGTTSDIAATSGNVPGSNLVVQQQAQVLFYRDASGLERNILFANHTTNVIDTPNDIVANVGRNLIYGLDSNKNLFSTTLNGANKHIIFRRITNTRAILIGLFTDQKTGDGYVWETRAFSNLHYLYKFQSDTVYSSLTASLANLSAHDDDDDDHTPFRSCAVDGNIFVATTDSNDHIIIIRYTPNSFNFFTTIWTSDDFVSNREDIYFLKYDEATNGLMVGYTPTVLSKPVIYLARLNTIMHEVIEAVYLDGNVLTKNTVYDIAVIDSSCPQNCIYRGSCDQATKACTCNSGYFGDSCQTFCVSKTTCNSLGLCNDDGACVCATGYEGEHCTAGSTSIPPKFPDQYTTGVLYQQSSANKFATPTIQNFTLSSDFLNQTRRYDAIGSDESRYEYLNYGIIITENTTNSQCIINETEVTITHWGVKETSAYNGPVKCPNSNGTAGTQAGDSWIYSTAALTETIYTFVDPSTNTTVPCYRKTVDHIAKVVTEEVFYNFQLTLPPGVFDVPNCAQNSFAKKKN